MAKTPIEITEKTDAWTDKQWMTVRRDCVQLAMSSDNKTLHHANDIFNFIKDGKVPEGGWK